MDKPATNGLKTRADYEEEIEALKATNELLLRDTATLQIGYMAQRWARMEDEFNKRLRALESKVGELSHDLGNARKALKELKRKQG